MEIAKITSKGQITIPVGIRRQMNIKEGDKIIFLEKDGKVFIINSDDVALNYKLDKSTQENKFEKEVT
jgi:antitoxin PrlF